MRLLLVPTAMERDQLLLRLGDWPQLRDVHLELCGFGVIGAAATSAMLIAKHQPSAVILAGIAGSLGDCLPIGQAFWMDHVIGYGIGVGQGDDFQTAQTLGWHQARDGQGRPLGDILPLFNPHPQPIQRTLVTRCAASTIPVDREWVPNFGSIESVDAEDMEGFAVALACTLAGIPCSIVRGISNVAGDRNPLHWQIPAALDAVANRLRDEHSLDLGN